MLTCCARSSGQAGFTLVEMMIAVGILGLLLAMGIPAYKDWSARTKIRTMTESMVSGLVLARNQSLQRNQRVRFSLTSTMTSACALSSSGPNWIVSMDDPAGKCNIAPSDAVAPRIIQARAGAEGGKAATVAALNADDGATSWAIFTGLGRGILADADGNKPISTINISYPAAGTCQAAGGNVRCLRIQITAGGEARICDPAVSDADDPRTC